MNQGLVSSTTKETQLRRQSEIGGQYLTMINTQGFARMKAFLIGKYMTAISELCDQIGNEENRNIQRAYIRVIREIFSEIGEKIDFGQTAQEELISLIDRRSRRLQQRNRV